MTRLSLLIVTVGRPTLARTLESLSDQAWVPGDEVLVASDDAHDEVGRIVSASSDQGPLRHLQVPGGPYRDWGHTPRNLMMTECKADYLMHLDDDDLLCPHAIANIRAKLIADAVIHLFRFVRYQTGVLTWPEENVIELGHVGTPNIVHPNIPETFGEWGQTHEGDFDFIKHVCGRVPVAWHNVITVVVDPPTGLTVAQARSGTNCRGGRPIGWRSV